MIGRSTIDRITDAKLAEGVTNATVNRLLEVVRAPFCANTLTIANGLIAQLR